MASKKLQRAASITEFTGPLFTKAGKLTKRARAAFVSVVGVPMRRPSVRAELPPVKVDRAQVLCEARETLLDLVCMVGYAAARVQADPDAKFVLDISNAKTALRMLERVTDAGHVIG
jgi:hypothetical protein